MRNIWIGLLIVVCLAVLTAGLCVTCDWIMDSAQAEPLPVDSLVGYNALKIKSPMSWEYDLSNITSTQNLTSFYPNRAFVYVGSSGSTVGTLYHNRLSSSVLSTAGNYVRLDFRVARTDLISLIDDYNSLYGTSISNVVTFTMNINIVSSYYIGQVWGRSSLDGAANNTVALSASSTQGIRSLTLDLDTYNYAYYSFIIQTYGTVDILGLKVEVGSSFTGFVYDDYLVNGYVEGLYDGRIEGYDVGYGEGYDYGYSVGFTEGVEQYARRVFPMSFNNVEHPHYIDFGWSDMGITSLAELNDSYFSMTSAWFEHQGYTILSSGMMPLEISGSAVAGVALYLSTGLVDDFNSTPSGDVPTVTLSILEDRTYLYIYDNNFPSNWNPVDYPYARQITVTVQLGVSAFIEQMQEASETIGYNRGIQEGIEQGKEIGYRDGYDYGVTIANNGSWRSFLSALIGVPVSYILSFFDFELFGFNFLGVFKFVVTASMFIFIISTVLGKVKA